MVVLAAGTVEDLRDVPVGVGDLEDGEDAAVGVGDLEDGKDAAVGVGDLEDTEDAAVGVGDLEDLYVSLSKRLEQVVRLDVRAPEPVIQDACQFAWSRLVLHRDRVRREAAFAWLIKTAVHEAFKLLRPGRRELSLEAAIDQGGGAIVDIPAPGPAEMFEHRERLAQLERLPERQRRLLWLHGLGLSYAEMASHEGYTRRTVERQLLRAKRSVREAAI